LARYTNNFKGRRNRTEKAKHLRDEFDAIEAGFTSLAAGSLAVYNTVYTYGTILVDNFEVDPINGVMQEVTLTMDTTITIKTPLAGENDADSKHVALLIHGSNLKITNGWGYQTWKEKGTGLWVDTHTGAGNYASALIEFIWDGEAWVAICFTKNPNIDSAIVAGTTHTTFPFTKDLTDVTGTETLGMTRASPAACYDTNERLWTVPANTPRFSGSRHVRNWCAASKDLQGPAWEASNCTVSTAVGAGPASEDVDLLTFTAVDGSVGCWIVPHFGRGSATADPMKFAVRFKAKLNSGSTGSFRVCVAYMGKILTGFLFPCHKTLTFNIDNTWQDYGGIFDLHTQLDPQTMLINSAIAKRTLVKIMFMSTSGGVGTPVMVTDVQVEPLREGYPETVSEFLQTSIGASMTLSATGTGTFVDATKIMTLNQGQYCDFESNLSIGKSYLMVCRVTGSYGADLLLDEGRTFWENYSNSTATDNHYVQDAPFLFHYEGGVVRWLNDSAGNSTYTVNIYEVSGDYGVYDTEIANIIGADRKVTDVVGVPVASYLAEGVIIEKFASAANLLPQNIYRTFYNWQKSGLTTLTDTDGKISSHRGEFGIDGWPAHGTLLIDTMTQYHGSVFYVLNIPADTATYTFSMFTRKVFDAYGNQTVWPEYDRHVTKKPSRFVDIAMTLYGGNTIEGLLARIDVQRGEIRPHPNSPYKAVSGNNLSDWWQHYLSLTNDGTNTQLYIFIYPAIYPTSGELWQIRDPVNTDLAQTGWAIIDWAQVEVDGGTYWASSPMIGGQSRAEDVLTTLLPDGTMYDANGNVIGDVTTGIMSFTIEEFYKSVQWTSSGGEIGGSFLPAVMHNFGPDAEPPLPFKMVITGSTFQIAHSQYDAGITGNPLTYDYVVDWGDGNTDHITAWNQAELSHTYAASSTYTITIVGACPSLQQGVTGPASSHRSKIQQISAWGNMGMVYMNNAFNDCYNLTLTATDKPDFSLCKDIRWMFVECRAITTGAEDWDFSVGEFTSIRYLFDHCDYFNCDVGGWNLTGITDMQGVFNYCQRFNNNITGWDTSAVTNMSFLFFFNDLLNHASIANLDTSACTNFYGMFGFCNNFNVDVSGWTIPSALGPVNMGQMFKSCDVFNHSIDAWDVSAVTNMTEMFADAFAFNQGFPTWDTGNVTDMSYMFAATFGTGFGVFNGDISGFDTSKVTTMYRMLHNCNEFNQDISGWDISSLTTATDFMSNGTAFSTANYDLLLNAWAAQTVKSGVAFRVAATFTIATSQTAHDTLTNAPNNWTITDGGGV